MAVMFRYLRRSYIIVAIYLAITVLIGFGIILLSLDGLECNIVLNLQSFVQKTLGIQLFQALTYLGDFYLWVIFTTIFFFYTYFKSRRNLNTSTQLVTYLILITASTYFLKAAYARPRPHCADIMIYNQEGFFSYPSGHVSRAAGLLIILSKKRNTIRNILLITAIFLISLSRIVLGVHFPTDTFGAIFLSLAMHKASEITVYSFFNSSYFLRDDSKLA